MNIIDVCDNYGGEECLKQYYKKNKITDYKIYKGDSYDYNDSINKLLNNINNNTKIRIWSSKGNADDYLLLLYLCNLLKDKSNNISVIFTTDYNNNILSINALHYKEIDSIIKYEKHLILNDISKYSDEWKGLVRINSDLRVIEKGIIKNKNYSDYDKIILNILNKLGNVLYQL